MKYQNSIAVATSDWRDVVGERPRHVARWDEDGPIGRLLDWHESLHPEWHQRAACRPDHVETLSELRAHVSKFTPIKGGDSAVKVIHDYCVGCEVRAECQAAKDETNSIGVWGGKQEIPRMSAVHASVWEQLRSRPGVWGPVSQRAYRALSMRRSRRDPAFVNFEYRRQDNRWYARYVPDAEDGVA